MSAPADDRGRFAKGRSGNPKGRPRKAKALPNVSAFDIIIDRKLTVIQNGVSRELTIDEALEQKTYQDAIGGSRLAEREIMKMIDRREQALLKQRPALPGITLKIEQSPTNADAALLLLDIVQFVPLKDRPGGSSLPRTSITTWALREALDRGRGKLSHHQLEDARRDALAPDEIRWPRPVTS